MPSVSTPSNATSSNITLGTEHVSVLLPSVMERRITVVRYFQGGYKEVKEDIGVIHLNEYFRFHDVWVNAKDLALYIDDPTCLVISVDLSTLVYWYRCFLLDDLKSLCRSHGITHGRRTKVVLGNEMHRHVCLERCARLVYVFKSLPQQRRNVVRFFAEGDAQFQFSYVPPAPKSSVTGSIATLVPDAPVDNSSACLPDVDKGDGSVYDHLKPADKNLKENIIREWQDEMSGISQRLVVCAVCAIGIASVESVLVSAEDIDLTLLRNDYIPTEAMPTSYDLVVYKRAILHPLGLEDRHSLGRIRLCVQCHKSLLSSAMPKYALSNWLYYGFDELPDQVLEAFKESSIFDKMLVCRARANSITCRFSTANIPDPGSEPGTKSGSVLDRARKGIRGNVLVAPLDVVRMNSVIPPSSAVRRDTMCAVFIGDKIPTRASLKYYSPILVRKSRVKTMIEFLLKFNIHYRPTDDFGFSEDNLNGLFTGDEEKLPRGVHVGYIEGNDAIESTVSDYTQRNEYEHVDGESYDELLMENVGYTEGDNSPLAYLTMKALALERCLQGKPFVASGKGSQSVPDFRNPSILAWLFPHLDPWGIGGFFHPGRRVKINMFDQLRHLLRVYDSPFQRDPEFAFVFYNVCRKATVAQNLRFVVSRNVFRKVASDLLSIDPEVVSRLTEECQKNPHYRPKEEKERNVFKMLSSIRTVSKHLPGSDGYKIMMRNEIRALINYQGTPTLFITLNPSDVDHPLVRLLGGQDIQLDDLSGGEELSKWQRSLFAAKNPSACAKFFDIMITRFISIVLRHGREGGGLYGRCTAYYGTVEAQGKGTLHCHMLIWLQGHLSPQELRRAMLDSDVYRDRVLAWMESVISCEFPGSESVEQQAKDFPRRCLYRETGDPHPGTVQAPLLKNSRCIDDFWVEYGHFLRRILHHFAWHEHQATCWKYLERGQAKTDENCRMGMNGCTNEKSSFDEVTCEIFLRRHHPRIASHTDVVSFLMQCNMDVKHVGTGEAAKSFLYYVTDYITKASLSVHVGMSALSYAIKKIYSKIPGDSTTLSDAEAKGAVITAVNSMMGRQEISQPQVMSYLIGGGDHYKSHRFAVLQWGAFEKYHSASLDADPRQHPTSHDNSSLNDVSGQDAGSVSMSFGDRSITASSQYLDYVHRPVSGKFDNLCLYDFVAWTNKLCFGGKTEGRTQCELAGEFLDRMHPQHSTHYLSLRRRCYIPVILGPSIPNPDRSAALKETWSRFMLILFKPWRDISILKGSAITWTDAFVEYEPHLFHLHRKIIKNMQALTECGEARDRHRDRNRGTVPQDETGVDFDYAQIQEQADTAREVSGFDVDTDDPDPFRDFELNDRSGSSFGYVLSETSSRLLDMCLPFKMEDVIVSSRISRTEPSTITSERDTYRLIQHETAMRLKRRREQDDGSVDDNEPGRFLKSWRSDDPIAERAVLGNDFGGTRYDNDYMIVEAVISEYQLGGNEQQLKAFRIISRQVIERYEAQLLMYVAGVGGTGKSHIIKAVVTLFERLNKRHELLLGAPTGIAAVLINGHTLHSLINLTPNVKRANATQLIDTWKGVKFLIVDEVSMIGARFLSQMSNRIRQGKGDDCTRSGLPFGGVNVIFMGDFGQLKPPRQYALYANELVKNPSFAEGRNNNGISAMDGVFLWRQVQTVIELRKNQRHSDDPTYAAFLNRLRIGKCIVEGQSEMSDLEYLRTRLLENRVADLTDLERFKDAPIIVGSKSLRDLLNVKLIKYHSRRCGTEPILYFSRDFVDRTEVRGTIRDRLWGLPSSINREAFGRLPLFVGMKVMVTENLALGNGVVNGSEGLVTDIKYEEDTDSGLRYAKVVYVRIPGCGIKIEDLDLDVVPIFPVITRIEHGLGSRCLKHSAFSRRQVPLVPAYVYTDYKSQGRTLPVAIVDLVTARGQGVYVMLSRVKSLSGLLILRWFPPNKIYHRLSEELRTELQRVEELALATPDPQS